MELESIETDRLLLKKLTPEDLQNLFKKHSEEFIIGFLGLTSRDEFTREREKLKEATRPMIEVL